MGPLPFHRGLKTNRWGFWAIGLAVVWMLVPRIAMAYTLSMVTTDENGQVTTEFDRGQAIHLRIVLDDGGAAAACAFTLNYPEQALQAPAIDAQGLAVETDGITSAFPFVYVNPDWSEARTHRANSGEAGTISLAGAAVDQTEGGALYASRTDVTLFEIKFIVPAMPPSGDFRFTLTQTELFSPDAGYGTDANGDGLFDASADTRGRVPILVGAQGVSDDGYENLACSSSACAFPLLMADTTDLLAEAWIHITDGDTDGDGLLDSVETGTGVFVDANDTGTDPHSADTDGDGMPDGWEVSHGLNPVLDDADADPDGDGLTNLEEYQQGTDPQNAMPDAPVLIRPADGATDVTLQPTLETGPFADADGDAHGSTEWQISRVFGSFADHALVFKGVSTTHLTTLSVPRFILEAGDDYYWRARFFDSRGEPSPWSAFFLFTTAGAGGESSDGWSVGATVDLDADGTPDVEQNGLKATRSFDRSIDLAVKGTAKVLSVDAVAAEDPGLITETAGRPAELPMGLIAFKITVPAAGDTAQVTIHFSRELPSNARWYKFDAMNGWRDFSGQAAFGGDRRSVVLTIRDGGDRRRRRRRQRRDRRSLGAGNLHRWPRGGQRLLLYRHSRPRIHHGAPGENSKAVPGRLPAFQPARTRPGARLLPNLTAGGQIHFEIGKAAGGGALGPAAAGGDELPGPEPGPLGAGPDLCRPSRGDPGHPPEKESRPVTPDT